MEKLLFTSESVTEGHPDKVCDAISDAILDALIRRSYESPLQTAKSLSANTNVSSYTRMAMLFQACRSSSALFLNNTCGICINCNCH